jgi:hypothetical protein
MKRIIIFFLLILLSGAAFAFGRHSNSSFKFEENGKYGVKDEYGEFIVNPEFDGICALEEGFGKAGHYIDDDGFIIVIKDGKQGYVSAYEGLVIEPKFNKAYPFSAEIKGYARVEAGGKTGFTDKKGNLKFLFDAVSHIDMNGVNRRDFLFPVFENGKYGMINKKADVVIAPEFDELRIIREGISGATSCFDHKGAAVVKLNGRPAFLHAAGDSKYSIEIAEFEDIAPIEDLRTYFSKGLAAVKIDGKWGYANAKNKIIISPQFEEAGGFFYDDFIIDGKPVKNIESDFAKVKLNGKWGIINTEGKFIIKPAFEGVNDFYDEKPTGVKINGKWGYVNDKSKIIIEPQFEEAGYFSAKTAGVKLGGKWGIINLKGKFIIEPKFDYPVYFENGTAIVSLDGKRGVINDKGEIITKPQ